MILNELAQVLSSIPFNRVLGLKLDAVHEDKVILSFSHKKELIGNFLHGILHGGVISSVLDMAGGVAAMIAIVQKYPDHTMEQLALQFGKSSTINLHIDYLRPGKGETFTANARLLRSGSKISVAHMELFNEQSVLIATGTGTYFIG